MIGKKSLFRGVKWVFIDLDDTLWDFSANSDVTLQKLYRKFEIFSRYYPEYNEFDEAYHLKNSELWDLYHHGHIEQEYLKLERFRWLLVSKGYDCGDVDELSAEMNEWYLDELSRCSALVDGAIDLLELLGKRYLIGVLSNGFADVQYRKLQTSGLWRYVQRMVVSDEIGVQKPDKRIFDYALREVGAEANEVIMIGDNPDADIQGAKSAGWRAIYFNRKSKPSVAVADAEVASLSDVVTYLEVLD